MEEGKSNKNEEEEEENNNIVEKEEEENKKEKREGLLKHGVQCKKSWLTFFHYVNRFLLNH